jgi:hypothetical protein
MAWLAVEMELPSPWRRGRPEKPHFDKGTSQDLGLGVLTMMRNGRQSLWAHAGERLPALASRVTLLSHF